MLVWKDVPAVEKANMTWLQEQRKLFVLPSYPNTLVSFSSKSKDDYFAALKGSRRHQLKKKLRFSKNLVQLTVETIQDPTLDVLDEIFGLFMQTFERSPIKFERLNRRTFELLAAEPSVHFILLREPSGGLIAFMMCFAVGDLVINKYIGFDYGRPKEWMLYFRLWEAALDWSLERGASGIQSGQTCYQPKIEQGHELKPLFNYGRHLNPLMHWIYRKVAATITWQSLDEDLATYLKAHPEADVGRP
jgi:predicted N-acyltransferase